MCATVLAFPEKAVEVIEADCATCGAETHGRFFECTECGDKLCGECSECTCDRLALIVKRSRDRMNPSVWTRVRRWFNRGV